MKSFILVLGLMGQWKTTPAFQPSKVILIQDRAEMVATVHGDVGGETYFVSGKLGCPGRPGHIPPKTFPEVALNKLSTEASLNYRAQTLLGVAPDTSGCEAKFYLERISPKQIVLKVAHSHMDQGHIYPLVGDLELRIDRKIVKIALREQYNFRGEFVAMGAQSECNVDKKNFYSPPDCIVLMSDGVDNSCGSYPVGSWPIKGGTTVKISFMYKMEQVGTTILKLNLYQYDSNGSLGDPDNQLGPFFINPGKRNGYWNKYTKTVQISPKADSFTFSMRISDGIGIVWIDDLTVSPVPEPRVTP